jgi:hypothetical protein
VRGLSQTVVGGRETGIGVLGDGPGNGVVGRSDSVAIEAGSRRGTALIATTDGGSDAAVFVNQRGSGEIIIGRNADNAEVFRVLLTGDVEVRGVALTSDKTVKANFSHVERQRILERLVRIPIQSWNYTTDPATVRHVGPNAHEFREAFGLNGDDDAHIASVDAQGIALVAIQALNEKFEQETERLRSRIAGLESRLATLES